MREKKRPKRERGEKVKGKGSEVKLGEEERTGRTEERSMKMQGRRERRNYEGMMGENGEQRRRRGQ